ncbi:predicted protein [Uncinocarpus reesii 1704]|uniref:Uncharacterized protein n=1 Tax=Uncinocarpus reesii (strain UAMH 1704) TaxID=336963 RepID=C4JDK9_UNCRE|nr:uncharacterized protein UREG_00718 [Uncinocarpus reesii 1704]EEP75871.1 predicted protein [Uncinocarpus reesii 1704]
MSSSYAAIIKIENLLPITIKHDSSQDVFKNGCSLTKGIIPKTVAAGSTADEFTVQSSQRYFCCYPNACDFELNQENTLADPAKQVSGTIVFTCNVGGDNVIEGAEVIMLFKFICGPKSPGSQETESAAWVEFPSFERLSAKVTPFSASDKPIQVTFSVDQPLSLSGRGKRGLFNSTTRVENNSDQVVYCVLNPAANGVGTAALAITGACLALTGFPPVGLLMTTSTAWVLGVIGTFVATAGLFDTFNAPKEYPARHLFPYDKMSATSSGYSIGAQNNLFALTVATRGNAALTCSSASFEGLGNEKLTLKNETTFKELFSVKLPKKSALHSYRVLKVKLKPHEKYSTIDPPSGKTPDQYVSYSKWEVDTTDTKYYNTVYIDKSLESDYTALFDPAPDDYALMVTQGADKKTPANIGNVGDYKIVALANGDIILELLNCKVFGTRFRQKPVQKLHYDHIIHSWEADRNIFAMDWEVGQLREWQSASDTQIKRNYKKGAPGPSVYIYVPHSNVRIQQGLVEQD